MQIKSVWGFKQLAAWFWLGFGIRRYKIEGGSSPFPLLPAPLSVWRQECMSCQYMEYSARSLKALVTLNYFAFPTHLPSNQTTKHHARDCKFSNLSLSLHTQSQAFMGVSLKSEPDDILKKRIEHFCEGAIQHSLDKASTKQLSFNESSSNKMTKPQRSLIVNSQICLPLHTPSQAFN